MTSKPQNTGRPGIMRWVWRVLGSILILLLALVLIVPVVFKDEIVETARKAVERNIHGQFTFEEAQVGLLKAFPNFCLRLSNVTLTGQTQDTLDQPLFMANAVEVILDLRSVMRKDVPVEVVGLQFDTPNAYLKVSRDGRTNYDVIRNTDSLAVDTTQGEASSFALEIRKYAIENGSITYIDHSAGVSLRIVDLFHDGKVSFAEQAIDIDSRFDSGKLAIVTDGITYLRDADISGTVPLHIDLDSSLYRVDEAVLNVNALQLAAHGDIRMSDDMIFDLSFTTSRGDFKEFLSLLPNAYMQDFDAVQASGNLALDGQLSGRYAPESNTYPEYRVHLQIDNAAFQYPGKDLAFDEIQMIGTIANQPKSWNPEYLDVQRFHFVLNGAPVDGKLRAAELTGAQRISGSLIGSFSLADFMAAYPVEGFTSLSGEADVNVEFNVDARTSADKQVVSGHLSIQDFLVQGAAQQIAARRVSSDFSTRAVTLKTQDATVDFHPIVVDIAATNLLPWYLHNDTLQLRGTLQAQKLAYEESTTTDTSALESSGGGLNYDKIALDMLVACDSVEYDEYVFTKVNAQLSGPVNRLDISDAAASIRGSRVSGKGRLQNVTGYIFNGETLNGQFDLRGDKLELDAWMTESDATATGGGAGETMIYTMMPPALDIAVAYNVNLLTYDKMQLRDVSGTLHVGDRNVQIEKMEARGLGGTMHLAGIYSTPPGANPDFNLKYDLANLKFVETIEQTDLFEILAPIAKFIEGEFSSTLVMQGKLGKDYMPDLKSLTASGYLETIHGKLEKAQVLDKVSSFLNISPPLNWDLGYTRNWFEIQDGAVELKEFTKQLDDVAVTMVGRHEIQGSMNYTMQFTIPAERLRSNPAGALAQQGIEAIQKRLGTLGRNIQNVQSVMVQVNITGKLADPDIRITNVKVNQQSAGDFADQLVQDTKQQLADTARQIVDTKVKTARDSANAIVQRTADSLKTALEQKATKAGQAALEEGKKQLDARLDSTSAALADSAKAGAIEILGEKAGGEIDKIKDNLDNWNPLKKKKKE